MDRRVKSLIAIAAILVFAVLPFFNHEDFSDEITILNLTRTEDSAGAEAVLQEDMEMPLGSVEHFRCPEGRRVLFSFSDRSCQRGGQREFFAESFLFLILLCTGCGAGYYMLCLNRGYRPSEFLRVLSACMDGDGKRRTVCRSI